GLVLRVAMASDAGASRCYPLCRELAGNLLPRCSTGACQPHSAGPHLGWDCDADRAQPRWYPGDGRGRNAVEFDQDQTEAAAGIIVMAATPEKWPRGSKDYACRSPKKCPQEI